MKKLFLMTVLALSVLVASAQPRLFVKPNEPLGEGKGIHPGRVAWIHSPGVATWDGETGLWVEERWNDQQKADGEKMLRYFMNLCEETKAKREGKK